MYITDRSGRQWRQGCATVSSPISAYCGPSGAVSGSDDMHSGPHQPGGGLEMLDRCTDVYNHMHYSSMDCTSCESRRQCFADDIARLSKVDN